MESFDKNLLKQLFIPSKDSHKGQNGKLLVIGGSKLFHAAPIWSLRIASRIVDMVYFASIPENNEIIKHIKSEFLDGIVIRRDQIGDYIKEADCILIGPGLPRQEGQQEGEEDTKELTERLLRLYPEKKWVIDGGSLQEIDPEVLLNLKQIPILTPHHGEFEKLFKLKSQNSNLKTTTQNLKLNEEMIKEMALKYKAIILLKGPTDTVCSSDECIEVSGGNVGITKGGTGDVLAGLVASFYCKNHAFLSAACASYINKKAGEELYKRVGLYFNASDLADEIPKVMKKLLFS